MKIINVKLSGAAARTGDLDKKKEKDVIKNYCRYGNEVNRKSAYRKWREQLTINVGSGK